MAALLRVFLSSSWKPKKWGGLIADKKALNWPFYVWKAFSGVKWAYLHDGCRNHDRISAAWLTRPLTSRPRGLYARAGPLGPQPHVPFAALTIFPLPIVFGWPKIVTMLIYAARWRCSYELLKHSVGGAGCLQHSPKCKYLRIHDRYKIDGYLICKQFLRPVH